MTTFMLTMAKKLITVIMICFIMYYLDVSLIYSFWSHEMIYNIQRPLPITCSELNTPITYSELDTLNNNGNVILETNLSDFISNCLNQESVIIRSDRDIIVDINIEWKNSSNSLTLIARENIIFKPNIQFICAGNLFLKAGIKSRDGTGTLILEWPELYKGIRMKNDAKVNIHYNPHYSK